MAMDPDDFDAPLADFGETVSFHPYDGAAFDLLVLREVPDDSATIAEVPGHMAPRIVISAKSNALTAALSREIDKARDKIMVATRKGGTPVLRTITAIDYTDDVMWKFECR